MHQKVLKIEQIRWKRELISDLEDTNLEMIQVEEERELRFLKSEETLQEL